MIGYGWDIKPIVFEYSCKIIGIEGFGRSKIVSFFVRRANK